MASNNREKLPVAENLEAIQARIDLAIAKQDAMVKSWVDKFDTSKCAPSKTKEEIEAWDAELFNPMPSNLGLGAPIPKEYLNGDINRKDISGNSKLRSLMMGKKAGLQAAKLRDAEEKASSMKRGLKEDTSDDEEGRSNLGRSKKAKREVAKAAALKTTAFKAVKQTKPLPLQQKAQSAGESDDEDSRATSQAPQTDSNPKVTKHTETTSSITSTSEPPNIPAVAKKKLSMKADTPATAAINPLLSAEAEARREKNRMKKAKQKQRKRKEREQALAGAGSAKDAAKEE
ncbi:hypothetical protein VC83_00879 [Pseudogymnoascus destructans]|uniref:Uncharacterized protein n=2 Tax=Pseudogymnoascus destructans TaxID=655981 RepID=L8FMG1_PSED2|nr:uncharacterized protein VC83_00879 [Pseudogymnoascus destructans]ELR01658.1 hypothetical protein GMDG_00034 [Pseudogymnoascus destructans 20631-21]OAF62777.1 hypothetical protein VC83_00879 [Pseudogymnoascus destructans]